MGDYIEMKFIRFLAIIANVEGIGTSKRKKYIF